METVGDTVWVFAPASLQERKSKRVWLSAESWPVEVEMVWEEPETQLVAKGVASLLQLLSPPIGFPVPPTPSPLQPASFRRTATPALTFSPGAMREQKPIRCHPQFPSPIPPNS